MNDVVKVFALGGLDENGRDCYVVEINNDIFVLDCGTCLPDKTIPGIDYIVPNPSYLIKNKDRIKAYIITHGHDESMSGLKYFYTKAPAPVYATKQTLALMVGQAKNININLTVQSVVVEPTSTVTIADREVRFFQTCHNTINSCGVAIWTTQGWVVYTSDFIIDFVGQNKGYYFDLQALEDISKKPTLLLMSESKNATKPGYCSPKHRVAKLIEKHFAAGDKRIFISCFWQNVFRIEEICELCAKYKKKLFYYDDQTRTMMTAGTQAEPAILHGTEVVDKENLLRVREKDLVILILGKDEELYETMADLAEGKNPDKRMVLTDKDIFINVSLPRPMLETKCTRSMDLIYRTGCEVAWLKKDQLTAMHARKDDLKFFMTVLRPKYYMPVRGNFINMMANAKLAVSMNIGLNYSNVFILDNGMQIYFDGVTRPQIIPNEVNKIVIDPILIDGTGINRLGANVIEDRLTLSQDGVVVIAGTVDLTKKEIIAGPDCQMRGFVFVKESEPLLKSLSNIYIDIINTALQTSKFDVDEINAMIADKCKRFIKRENGREPHILSLIETIN